MHLAQTPTHGPPRSRWLPVALILMASVIALRRTMVHNLRIMVMQLFMKLTTSLLYGEIGRSYTFLTCGQLNTTPKNSCSNSTPILLAVKIYTSFLT